MEILNLDELVSEDKKVTLKGKDYIIPGDVPAEIMLRLMDNSAKMEKEPENPDVQREAYMILEDVLREKNDIEDGFLIKNINLKQYVKFVQFIYGTSDEEEVKKQEDESSGKLTDI